MMKLTGSVAALVTSMMTASAFAQLEDSDCADLFFKSQASSTCKILTSKIINDEAKCELVTQCHSYLAREKIVKVNVITGHLDEIQSLVNRHGELVVEP